MPGLAQLLDYNCGQQTCSIETQPHWLAGGAVVLGFVFILVIVYSIMTEGTEPKPPSEVGK